MVDPTHFSTKEAFWPFCALHSRDPFSKSAPMPKGWEKFLCENAPPSLPLQLEYAVQKRGAVPHYRKDRGMQKVTAVWKYLFDHYPYLLPREISRHPYVEDLPPNFPRPFGPIPPPWRCVVLCSPTQLQAVVLRNSKGP